MYLKNPEYFLMIARERSISKAAERLFLSQPYLSQYLAKLEGNLGVTLFDRSRNPLRITEAGRLFQAYLESQGHLDRQLESELRELKDNARQVIHIGLAVWRGSTLLPDILPVFTRLHPEVEIVLHETPASELEKLIEENVTDFCIMHIPADTSQLTYELIMQERILLVGNRSHPLLAGVESTLSDPRPFDITLLHDEQFIMLPAGWRLSQVIGNMLDTHQMSLRRRPIFTTNNTTAANLVAENMGFTFLPETGARRSYNLDKLAFFTIDDPPLACPLAIVYKKNGFISPAARAFIDVTRDYYKRFHQVSSAPADPS